MISNYFCLETHGIDKFHINPTVILRESLFYNWSDCILEETIEYQCPTLLIPLCMSEVNKQRPKVLDNLKTYLQSRKKYKISHQLLEGIKQKLQND